MASNLVFLCYSWEWDYKGLCFLCPLLGYIPSVYFIEFWCLSFCFILSYLYYYHLEAHLFSKKKQGVNQDERAMEEELKELG